VIRNLLLISSQPAN